MYTCIFTYSTYNVHVFWVVYKINSTLNLPFILYLLAHAYNIVFNFHFMTIYDKLIIHKCPPYHITLHTANQPLLLNMLLGYIYRMFY